jgi:hypothetical protein
VAVDADHGDVGAYVLGVLDPAGVEPFEAHLATCHSCADEVASLLPVVQLLPLADAETLLARQPEPRSLGPTRAPARAPGQLAPAAYRRAFPRHGIPVARGGRRLAVAAGIAAAVLAGGSFAAGAALTGTTPSGNPPSTNDIAGLASAGPSPAVISRRQATDAATGVRADLTVASVQWGSQIDLTLAGVRGPLRCELLAVGADQHSTVVASWLVSPTGYGVPGQPNPLRIQAATALSLGATSHFDIRATSPDGSVATLVSIPA